MARTIGHREVGECVQHGGVGQHPRLEPAEDLLHHLVGESLANSHQDAACSLLPVTVQLLHPKSHQVDLSLNLAGDTSKLLGPQGWLHKGKPLCSSAPSEYGSEATWHSLQVTSPSVGALMPKESHKCGREDC